MAADPLKQIFSRVWQTRVLQGINTKQRDNVPQNLSLNTEPILGFTNQANITTGSGTSAFTLLAGPIFAGQDGESLTLTVTNGGSLVVSCLGADITIQTVSGTTTAAQVVAAVNAFFTGTAANFVQAYLPSPKTNTGAGTTIPPRARRFFNSDQRAP